MRCSVPNCGNDTRRTTKTHGITFHLFPKEPDIRARWVETLGLSGWEPKERSTICSKHFQNEDFYLTRCGLRKIKNGVLPVLGQDSTDLDSPAALRDSTDLDSPAALRVCRICLAIDTKLYHIREQKLDGLFEQILGMPISEKDKLPQKICWECTQRLTNSAQFANKAIQSEGLLMDLLFTKEYLTIRDIKSINRTQNHLKSPLVTKYFEANDYDVYINGEDEASYEDVEFKEEFDIADDRDDGRVVPMMEVEIKDEENNVDHDIFFEEFPDPEHFEPDDDNDDGDEVIEKREKRSKEKKKLGVVKKEKVVKRKEIKTDDEEDPSKSVDKYKMSDVKRRKPQDTLDESLFTITTMTYDEQIAEIEKRQESNNYRTAPFKCAVCFRGFLIKDRYDAHVIRHSEASGAHECFICKTRFKTGRALRKHLNAIHREQLSCKSCPFVTRNRGVAKEHEKWHAGAKYQCPHCPSEFDKPTTYLSHIRIKHVSDFVCELCGYTFVSKKGINFHKKKKHLDEKVVPEDGPYCEVCDVRFVSDEAHSRHLKISSRHSSDSDPNRIRNDSQSQSMRTEKSGRVMRKIERRDPGTAEPSGPVTCEQCGIQLGDLRLYSAHFRRVHPDKNRTKYPATKAPCMCEQCGRIFQTMAHLKDHMWIHTGEKRFKCDHCEKSFTQKPNLVIHMRVHSSNARPTYKCPLCEKHFAFLNNRKRHMFVHTGFKPFKCEACGKCFTSAGEQRAHVAHVHLKKPWPKRARHRVRPPPTVHTEVIPGSEAQ